MLWEPARGQAAVGVYTVIPGREGDAFPSGFSALECLLTSLAAGLGWEA